MSSGSRKSNEDTPLIQSKGWASSPRKKKNEPTRDYNQSVEANVDPHAVSFAKPAPGYGSGPSSVDSVFSHEDEYMPCLSSKPMALHGAQPTPLWKVWSDLEVQKSKVSMWYKGNFVGPGRGEWCGVTVTWFLIVAIPTLYFIFIAPYTWRKLSPVVPICSAILVVVMFTLLLVTACTDPGIIPSRPVQILTGSEQNIFSAIVPKKFWPRDGSEREQERLMTVPMRKKGFDHKVSI